MASSIAAVGALASGRIRTLMGRSLLQQKRLLRVGAAGKNRKRAVELLGEDDACEFVRKRQRGEREFHLRALAQFGWKPLRIAAEKDELACAALAPLAEPFREFLRGEFLSSSIQQNARGRGPRRHLAPGRRGIAQFHGFHLAMMADAGQVIIQKRADFRAARFPEHQQANFHSEKRPRRNVLSRTAQTRSLQSVAFSFFEKGFPADAENSRRL